MTNILALKKDNSYRLECHDHADSTETCAMISALIYMLAGALENNPNVSELHHDLQPGYALITYKSDDIRADEDFNCCLIGLLQIENTYHDKIMIKNNIFR